MTILILSGWTVWKMLTKLPPFCYRDNNTVHKNERQSVFARFSHAVYRCKGAAMDGLGWLSFAMLSCFMFSGLFSWMYHPRKLKTHSAHYSKQLGIHCHGSGILRILLTCKVSPQQFHNTHNASCNVCMRTCTHCVCMCACWSACVGVLAVMRKMLNEVLQCVCVISRVHCALCCVFILLTLKHQLTYLLIVFALCASGSC